MRERRPKIRLLEKLGLALTAPLRYAVRHELRRHDRAATDLRAALQRRAVDASAAYVAERMGGVDSVTSAGALLDLAVAAADLSGGRLACEFGVFTGRSINRIARAVRGPVFGFDSFQGLPERWRDEYRTGHFAVDALPRVEPNVTLVKGWFNETLPPFLAEHAGDAGFLHVDCDLYSSTRTVFSEMAPRIKKGCVILFDEYFAYPGWEDGEFKAFQEFVEASGRSYTYLAYNRLGCQVAVRID